MQAWMNPSSMFVRKSQYLTVDSGSDQALALAPTTEVIRLWSTQNCWVNIGRNPTAAAPGGEKTKVDRFYLPALFMLEVAVGRATDAAPLKVAAIRDSADGTLHIAELAGT